MMSAASSSARRRSSLLLILTSCIFVTFIFLSSINSSQRSSIHSFVAETQFQIKTQIKKNFEQKKRLNVDTKYLQVLCNINTQG